MRYLIMLAALASATAGAAKPISDPKLLNLQELVTSEDYPRVALERHQEGVVEVRVNVDREGFVTDCSFVRSSGFAALDEQTCALFRARGRFAPARDGKDRPMAGTVRQKIRWIIGKDLDQPMPRHAWMMRQTVSLDRAGQVVGCVDESTGLSQRHDCLAVTSKESSGAAEKSSGAVAYSILESYFLPGDPDKAVMPPDLWGATNVARQVSRVRISAGGQVVACTGVTYTGAASPQKDNCATLLQSRFEKLADPAGPEQAATIVITLYVRKQSVV